MSAEQFTFKLTDADRKDGRRLIQAMSPRWIYWLTESRNWAAGVGLFASMGTLAEMANKHLLSGLFESDWRVFQVGGLVGGALAVWLWYTLAKKANRHFRDPVSQNGTIRWELDHAGIRVADQHRKSVLTWSGIRLVSDSQNTIIVSSGGLHFFLPKRVIGSDSDASKLLHQIKTWQKAAQ